MIRGADSRPGPARAWKALAPLLAVLAGLAGAGCGTVRSAATRGLIADVSAATLEHDDVDLVTQAMPTYLLLLDGLIAAGDDSPELLRSAAEAYTAYGTLVEIDDPERAAGLFRRGRDYGRQALVRRRAAVAPLLDAPLTRFTDIDADLRAEDLPFVFWAASSWGAWIGANVGSMAALADLPRVIHLMTWVLERDEAYRGGSPHVFLGVYHASLPPMLGGDPEAARQHFERALDLTRGADLMVRVHMARTYARQIFDRELYVDLLEEVLTRPVDTVPEFTLQNAIAQRLARRLLEDVDDYF